MSESQPSLFPETTGATDAYGAPRFDGATFDQERDGKRLNAQLFAVRAAMGDGQWWTLADLAERCGAPEASVSARIRDLRKPRFGGHMIERRFVRRGLFEYRMQK